MGEEKKGRDSGGEEEREIVGERGGMCEGNVRSKEL